MPLRLHCHAWLDLVWKLCVWRHFPFVLGSGSLSRWWLMVWSNLERWDHTHTQKWLVCAGPQSFANCGLSATWEVKTDPMVLFKIWGSQTFVKTNTKWNPRYRWWSCSMPLQFWLCHNWNHLLAFPFQEVGLSMGPGDLVIGLGPTAPNGSNTGPHIEPWSKPSWLSSLSPLAHLVLLVHLEQEWPLPWGLPNDTTMLHCDGTLGNITFGLDQSAHGDQLQTLGSLDGLQGKQAWWILGEGHLAMAHLVCFHGLMQCQSGLHFCKLFLAKQHSLGKKTLGFVGWEHFWHLCFGNFPFG